MDVNADTGAQSDPAESQLLNDMGMSPDASGTNPLFEESTTGQAGQQPSEQEFKFAGRTYSNRAEAEKAFGKLYGQHSETRGILNTVKKALNDPELLEELSQDPTWADIFSKLGIEAAVEGAGHEARGGEGDPSAQQMYQEWQVERDIDRLEREEFRFERELGRPLASDERRAVLNIIKRASSLSFKEAWQLAHHERLLAEARKPGGAPARPAQTQRPAPTPSRIPGQAVDSKKPINKMSDAEWKENLRMDQDLREMLSR